MPEPSGPNFKVDCLSLVRGQIRTLRRKANQSGMLPELDQVLERIIQRLEMDPLQWGDPAYHTVKEGGTVCHGIQFPLVVHFVVFEPEKFVCMLNIFSMPGHPLGPS